MRQRTSCHGQVLHHFYGNGISGLEGFVPSTGQADILLTVTFQCLKDCIESRDFMHVYNAIIVLKEILPVFPIASIAVVGPTIYGVMEKFLETEERGDLKILGRA